MNSLTALLPRRSAVKNRYEESIESALLHQDQQRLKSLDYLLRSLIHPTREWSNSKDTRAVEVAGMIREEHPHVTDLREFV